MGQLSFSVGYVQKCQHCGGRVLRDMEGEYSCLACGRCYYPKLGEVDPRDLLTSEEVQRVWTG